MDADHITLTARFKLVALRQLGLPSGNRTICCAKEVLFILIELPM